MTRYIFIDDAAETGGDTEDLAPLIDNVVDGARKRGENLEIVPVYPAQFDAQIKFLRREAFDGLILDLRLDEFAPRHLEDDDERKVTNYRATGLAQEIRTRATEGNMGSDGKTSGEFPLVLWSYNHKLRKSFLRDDTGHDLFDMKCTKESLQDVDEAAAVSLKLISLSNGYREILKVRSRKGGPGAQFFKFLGFDEDPGFLDPRLLDYFAGRETPLPAHEYARMIIGEMLEIPGPLINEETLAARLGVDHRESPDWNRLLERLPTHLRYDGPFKEGWPRWWAAATEKWWSSLEASTGPLRRAEAEERVKVLKAALDVEGLKAAEPIEPDYSTRYWTVCMGDKTADRPLDPIDGFVVDRKESFPWQDHLYISQKRALEGARHDDGLRLDPLERERLNELKQRLKKKK